MNFSANLPDFNATPFLSALEDVFISMGKAYDNAARGYGFTCTGCNDNCCLTRFYHHTLLEHLYIEAGFKTLNGALQADVIKRAEQVVNNTKAAHLENKIPRIMCPLNVDGLCILYHYRPMVCRLHGIEHELGQSPVRSRGCDLFTEQTQNMDYIPFDRTPLYIEMAKLEKGIRQTSGFSQKLKHTIAEMLLL